MADITFRLRSLGVATEGLPDQYADGKAAKVWEIYIGEKNDRTKHYRDFLLKLLKDHSCHHILDVACGTGEKNDRTKHYRDFLLKFLKDHSCHHILDVACGTG
ncbi:glycine N-methyltransferase [Caerostris extrusa]|uniref:Glycine N-methyltransferase n=1 Tax=Caerostris extrusa TaxID=172846 RepID=A0AAV4XKY3_CAEEX|nr:glycine N-methyltransferase [Caerostris extrusa]